MESMIASIVVACISGLGSLIGTCISHNKTTALVTYRLEQLEEKVNRHNNIIERTYKLEEMTALQEEKIKVANHRIDDLEKAREK